ncbi:MAG: hypothetical protein HYX51_02170 [Chloroflexi bacterium]|nr:hypothetical protein [Chloroflexota bacterium]
MNATILDDLTGFIRARMDAAARDKVLYDRNNARLNSQILQGEINMGTAVLAWLEKARQGETAAADDEEDDTDTPE